MKSEFRKLLKAQKLLQQAILQGEDSKSKEAAFYKELDNIKPESYKAEKFDTIARDLGFHGIFEIMQRVAEKALECDKDFVGANRHMGHALVEIGKHEDISTKKIKEGIERLERALALAEISKLTSLQEKIQVELLKARKIGFLK
mmetsp:Transcript_22031/g.27062  ORF Transcript_22031/g.27062 Transcript_22031/m.27062 type:complete len:145 (-) Transcript_22031:702-1136(-)|eukprot:CAMPEP_0170473784 /NCGR_PEP_ID=MMETSP0123-20130129/15632_1 /TAXON_ID=182087 /ORGANISM="Favella ehrenbergii, Strain Fehren 1" /LENGTH=144 /DNA_ID=CAMNT_0010743035 /DNA_START=1853 /DNA_END=2287 /DNA_ORIENTATION=-